jgi:hypothetical protein
LNLHASENWKVKARGPGTCLSARLPHPFNNPSDCNETSCWVPDVIRFASKSDNEVPLFTFRLLLLVWFMNVQQRSAQTGSGTHTASCPIGNGGRGLYPGGGVKATGAWRWWSCATTPPYVFMARCLIKQRDNFLFCNMKLNIISYKFRFIYT